MADCEIEHDIEEQKIEGAVDVEMGGEEVTVHDDVDAPTSGGNGENGVSADEENEVPARVTFAEYLKSPVVELVVGEGDQRTLLKAHQALLVSSPYFEDACSKFSDDSSEKRLSLSDENVDAVGCFLEYLYTGEYFPQKIQGERGLARDPEMPDIDQTGEELLKHARVYTLADKLKMGTLKTLAHSKIHCVNSSAKGEIAYARYVYATTPEEDETIRRPVAAFWARRSHVLRREAENEFRQMCLEFPQFCFDVLTRVLDEKLKYERPSGEKPGPGSSRKRQRQSGMA